MGAGGLPAWGGTGPASGKSLCLSVKARPGGGDTESLAGDEAFSPVVLGVRGEFMAPAQT